MNPKCGFIVKLKKLNNRNKSLYSIIKGLNQIYENRVIKSISENYKFILHLSRILFT